jgi:dynein heavy chain
MPILDGSQKNFRILDELQYVLEAGDFKARWTAYGWPQTIETKMIEVSMMLEQEKLHYAEVQEEQQAEFVENMKVLGANVNNLHNFTDMSKVESVAKHIASIKSELEKAEEEARLYNSREGLFDKNITEYAQVQ